MDVDSRDKEHEERFLLLFKQIGCIDLVNLYCNALEAHRDSIVLGPDEDKFGLNGFHKSRPEDFDAQIKFLRESGHTSPEVWARTWAHEMRDPKSPTAQAIEEMCATAKWLIPEGRDENAKWSHETMSISSELGPHYDSYRRPRPIQQDFTLPVRWEVDDDDSPMPSELCRTKLMVLHLIKGPEVFMKLFVSALEEQPDLDPLDMEKFLDGNEWVEMKPKDHLSEGDELSSGDEEMMVSVHQEWRDIASDLDAEYNFSFREMQIAFFEKQGGRVPPDFRNSFRLSYKSLPEIKRAEYNESHVAMQIEFFRKHGERIPPFVIAGIIAEEVELQNETMTEIARTMGVDL